jgi:alpha-L-rhamnosidase
MASGASSVRVERMCVDHLEEPIALARRSPRFSWHLAADGQQAVIQRAYRITIRLAAGDEPVVAHTDWVETADCVAVDVPGFVGDAGRDYSWTVQVKLTGAATNDICGCSTFGLGVSSWQAPWIEPEQSPVIAEGPIGFSPAATAAGTPTGPLADRLHPPRYLRHRFRLYSLPARARLRITSQGVHQPYLNGAPVGDGVLAPGYESYQHTISVMTHDVTDQLLAGDNVLGVILGDGWYAGRISFLGRSAQYGDRLRASWQLEITETDASSRVIVPGEQVTSARGPIDWSDLFIGERHDARREIPGWDSPGFDDTDPQVWSRCRTLPVDVDLPPFVGEPIRRVLELPVHQILSDEQGEVVIDFGQVIAGRVRMNVKGPAGTVVRLEHAEVVDSAGNFVNNIFGINKDQIDEYVLAGHPDGESWEPLFTFHGFRYVRLSGYPRPARPEDFTAVVIANDLAVTAGFASSDPRLDRLVENTVWSQRANFLAVPTDCPQRERAGWTGDVQIFAATAATLMGVAAFLDRWLANVRTDQRDHGGIVPNIVPEPPAIAAMGTDDSELAQITAAAGWGDVITIAPWELYRHYGDFRFLGDNLQAMRDWVDFQTRDAQALLPPRLRDTPLTGEQRSRHELLWNGRFNFGDWLAPSTLHGYLDDPLSAALIAPRLTAEIVGPMFQARSLDLLAAAADVLHQNDLARASREHAATVREAFAVEYIRPDGTMSVELQGVYVVALAFDMVPPAQIAAAMARLVDLIHAAGDHLDTGFLSVPYLLDVLWEHGHPDLARALILQDSPPSWLYEVKMGATTIWETWQAIHEDGRVEIASMNHYAFGCVTDWIIRRLAGIDLLEPGYRLARLAPDLDGFLRHCRAHVDTPYGRLAIAWQRRQDTADLTITVPSGATAQIDLPHPWALDTGAVRLGPGTHQVRAHRTSPAPLSSTTP